jgi:hypothetical protein
MAMEAMACPMMRGRRDVRAEPLAWHLTVALTTLLYYSLFTLGF